MFDSRFQPANIDSAAQIQLEGDEIKSVIIKIESGEVPTVNVDLYSVSGQNNFLAETVITEGGTGPVIDRIKFPISELSVKTYEPFLNKIQRFVINTHI